VDSGDGLEWIKCHGDSWNVIHRRRLSVRIIPVQPHNEPRQWTVWKVNPHGSDIRAGRCPTPEVAMEATVDILVYGGYQPTEI
jgi:hypothetical protein